MEKKPEKFDAEKEIKNKERFLENVFESIQDGISVLDKDMNIIRVNHAMEKWYKHAMPLIGKKCYEAYHGRHERCEICPSYQTLKNGKMAYELNPKTGPDGTIIGWFDLYSFPLLDDETGELKGVIEYVRDITERKKAEEALALSEKRYRLIVETATEGILTIDKGDVITFSNKRICEMLGYVSDGIIGKDIFELMDEEWKTSARSDIESLRRGGRERHDFKFKRMDGTDLWAIVSATPIFDELHQYTGALYMVTGISERKRAEEASRAVENKYRKLMEMATDAIIIVDPDTGTILDVNKQAEEMMGLPLERLIGMNYQQLHPKDKAKYFRRIFEDSVRTGNMIVTDATVIRGDGRIVPVEIRGNLVGIGGKKVMQGLFRDMTERIAAEEKLRKSEDRLKAILNNSPAIIYGRGTDGRYIFVNKAFEKLLHLKEKRVLENTPYDIFTKDIADMFQKTDVKVLETGETLEVEELLPLPDSIHTYMTQKFPLLDKEGNVYAMCGISTDITARKKMEDELNKCKADLERKVDHGTKELEKKVDECRHAESEANALRQQIELVLGATKTGLDIIDAEYNIRYIDPEWKKVYGNPKGKKCYEYFMDKKSPCPGCGVTKALNTKKTVVSEEVLVKEGNRPIMVTTVPFKTSEGEWLVAEINMDISERKKMEECIKKNKESRGIIDRSVSGNTKKRTEKRKKN